MKSIYIASFKESLAQDYKQIYNDWLIHSFKQHACSIQQACCYFARQVSLDLADILRR